MELIYKSIEIFNFFYTKSLKSSVDFKVGANLSSDEPHFNAQKPYVASGTGLTSAAIDS